MTALKILLTAVLSITELFILTKIMGKRQVSQLNLFDYINGITIGSIAAEMAFSPIEKAWEPALAMAVYAIITLILSIITNKSISFRRLFNGRALILMNNGSIYRNNLKKCKMDVNEFLTQCRLGGFFNPDDLQTVIMEPNGQLSFLPKAETRPANPKDFNLTPDKEFSPITVISDGKILHGNLESCGKNEIWLRDKLKEGHYPPIDKIFLCLCTNDNEITVYDINNERLGRDIYS